jgi:hypothetical protein
VSPVTASGQGVLADVSASHSRQIWKSRAQTTHMTWPLIYRRSNTDDRPNVFSWF